MDENEMRQPDKDLDALFKAEHPVVTANVITATSDKPNDIVMSTQDVAKVETRLIDLEKFVQHEKTKRLQELEPELESLEKRLQTLGYKLDNNKAVPILDMNLLCAILRDPVNGASILKDTWTLIKSYHAVDPSMLDDLRQRVTKLQSERSSVITTNPDSPTLSETNDIAELWWPDAEIDVGLCAWKRTVRRIENAIRREKRFSELMAEIEMKQHYQGLIAEYEERKCKQEFRALIDTMAASRSMEDIATYHIYDPEEM